jgi:hypothetical protein
MTPSFYDGEIPPLPSALTIFGDGMQLFAATSTI